MRRGVYVTAAVVLASLLPTGVAAARSNYAASPFQGKYIALGDSVAAGIGLDSPVDVTDPACGVTNQAYPVFVAQGLHLASYGTVACSGATAGDLVTEQHLSDTSRDIEPQLNRAFAGGTPSLMTITAGANDMHWTYFLRKCYVSSCGTKTDKAASKALATALRLKLEYALGSIQRRSNGQPPQVILTGYYKPLSKACTKQQNQVTSAELKWLNSQTDTLNSVISKAVRAHDSFAHYAAVSFSGHELCSKQPWVQGLQDAAPFHPTVAGQQAIAKSVLRQVD